MNKKLKDHFHWVYINYPEENNWSESDQHEDKHYVIRPISKDAQKIIRSEIRIYLLEIHEHDMIISNLAYILDNLMIYITR